jgi:hypothetical protein
MRKMTGAAEFINGRPAYEREFVDRHKPVPRASTALFEPRVRFKFTPPERSKFEMRAGLAAPNVLYFLILRNLTRMAVVRLRRRKRPLRARNGPKRAYQPIPVVRKPAPKGPRSRGFGRGPCAEKNVPTGCLGGGKLTRREHSFRCRALKHHHVGVRPHDEGVCKQRRGTSSQPGR